MITLFIGGNISEMLLTLWFIGLLTLFYVFIGSLVWELSFHIIPFKASKLAAAFYFIFGVIYGGIALTIITSTIGEATPIVWVVGMSMIGLAALIFYLVRWMPYWYS